MGFFSDDSPSPGDELAQQQIAENKAELERKKQSLYKQKLDIVKTQGAINWSTPPTTAPTPAVPNFFGKPLGYSQLLNSAFGQQRGTTVGKQQTIG